MDDETGPSDVPRTGVILVKNNSDVKGIGLTILAAIEEERKATLRAIGAGAVNQAMKGVIRARQQMSSQGEELIVRPGFVTVTGNDGSDVTAMVLNCTLL